MAAVHEESIDGNAAARRAARLAGRRSDAVGHAQRHHREAPARASPPWLGIAASASADWSAKDRAGREVRVALELHFRGDDPATGVALTRAIEARVESLPREHEGFAIVTTTFLRARIERRTHNVRSALFEYRFRLLAT